MRRRPQRVGLDDAEPCLEPRVWSEWAASSEQSDGSARDTRLYENLLPLRSWPSADICAVTYLEQADQVLVLADDGTTADRGTFQDVKDCKYLENITMQTGVGQGHGAAEETADSEKPSLVAPPGPSADAELDLLRKSGDTSLYWYYLRSIGWRFGLVSLSLSVSACFFQIFPRSWLPWSAWCGHRLTSPQKYG